MNGNRPVEISCPSCGREALLLRQPKYEGFTKVGEILSCASCGHEFVNEEEIPFKGKPVIKVFTDADKPEDVKLFKAHEADRICRNCKNYVVNPFMQWCSHHKKEVEATDTCKAFAKKPEPKTTI